MWKRSKLQFTSTQTWNWKMRSFVHEPTAKSQLTWILVHGTGVTDLYNIASLITLRKIKEIVSLYLFITATFFRVNRNIVIFSNRTNNTKWQFHYSSVLCMCRNKLHVNKIRMYDALHVVMIQCIDHVHCTALALLVLCGFRAASSGL